VEKPDKAHAPSNVAILGRYILEPKYLNTGKPETGKRGNTAYRCFEDTFGHTEYILI
jgi:UTP-glucose-1-phosphate uridylyltransferase